MTGHIGKLFLVSLALVSVCCAASSTARVPAGPVKHYVVLMMENRAYDHMLGYFHLDGEHLNGLTGSESNPWNPSDPNGKQIKVTMDAKDVRLPLYLLLVTSHPSLSSFYSFNCRLNILQAKKTDETSPQFCTKISPNPDHEVAGVTTQVFGHHTPKPDAPATMSGFVWNSRHHVRSA